MQIIGLTCEVSGPHTDHRAYVRGVGPTCAVMGSRIGHLGAFPLDETTNFNVDFPAPISRKVATKPTRFVFNPRSQQGNEKA